MNFGTYVDVLASTGFFGNRKAQIGNNLFTAAGSCVEFSESAVKTWLNGTRSCDVGRYFPEESIDEAQFISYFRRRTNAYNLWKHLQMAFGKIEEAGIASGDFCVDLDTDDPEVFYWSLLNQFQRIFHLPESEREVNSSTESMLSVSQKKLSVEQVRNIFLDLVRQHNVMEILCKEYATLNGADSTNLNIFIDKMDIFAANIHVTDHPLYMSIATFTEILRLQALSLEATLNRLGFDDDTASVNMEDGDEDLDEDDEDDDDDENNEEDEDDGDDEDWDEDDEDLNQCGLPESEEIREIIRHSADPIRLLRRLIEEWENFRDEMNGLFKEISGIDKG